jgi:hypothetical protein
MVSSSSTPLKVDIERSYRGRTFHQRYGIGQIYRQWTLQSHRPPRAATHVLSEASMIVARMMKRAAIATPTHLFTDNPLTHA